MESCHSLAPTAFAPVGFPASVSPLHPPGSGPASRHRNPGRSCARRQANANSARIVGRLHRVHPPGCRIAHKTFSSPSTSGCSRIWHPLTSSRHFGAIDVTPPSFRDLLFHISVTSTKRFRNSPSVRPSGISVAPPGDVAPRLKSAMGVAAIQPSDAGLVARFAAEEVSG